MGMKTGVDLAKVVEAGHFISSALNRYFSNFLLKLFLVSFSLYFDAFLKLLAYQIKIFFGS
jgi:hypothetical protein